MRRLLIGIGVLLALLAGAAIAIPLLVPVSNWQQALSDQVQKATGRTLTIAGPVTLRVFPALALDVRDVTFAGLRGGPALVTLPQLEVVVAWQALFAGALVIDRLVLKEPIITLATTSAGRPNWQLTPPVSAASAEASAAGATPVVPVADLQLGNIAIRGGTIIYDDRAKGQREELQAVTLDLSLPSLDRPARLMLAANWRDEALQFNGTLTAPRAFLAGSSSKAAFSFTSRLLEQTFDGQLTNRQPLELNGRFTLKTASVRDLLAWVASPIATGGDIFGPLAFQGDVGGTVQRLQFLNAALELDALRLNGEATVDLSGPRPYLAGAVTGDRLDLTPYLPGTAPAGAAQDTASAAPSKQVAAGWSREPLRAEGLRAVNADLRLRLGELQVQAVRLGPVAVSAQLRNGVLTSRLTELALYGGQGTAVAVLDGSGSGLGVALTARLNDIQAQPLLRDALGFDRLLGRGLLVLDITGRGLTQDALLRSLAGGGEFRFADGAVRGINLAALVRNLQGAFLNALANETQQTDFSELAASFQMAGGVLRNDDLRLQSPLLRVTGAGSVDIGNQRVDYRVTPKAVADLAGQGGQAETAGLMVPVQVRGPWARLSFAPDLAAALTQGGDPVGAVKNILEQAKGLSLDTTAPKDAATANPQNPAAPVVDALKGLLGR